MSSLVKEMALSRSGITFHGMGTVTLDRENAYLRQRQEPACRGGGGRDDVDVANDAERRSSASMAVAAADDDDTATCDNNDDDDDNEGEEGGGGEARGDQDQPLWRKRPRSQRRRAIAKQL